jgi:hypothetical protein
MAQEGTVKCFSEQKGYGFKAASLERPPERLETGPIQHEPAEPADPERSERDREDLRRAQPERVEPEQLFTEVPSEPRSWWRRTFGF